MALRALGTALGTGDSSGDTLPFRNPNHELTMSLSETSTLSLLPLCHCTREGCDPQQFTHFSVAFWAPTDRSQSWEAPVPKPDPRSLVTCTS